MQRHYFVDYEVYTCGQLMHFGQLSISWGTDAAKPFDPDALLESIRQRAADQHGVEAREIRIKSLSRL